MVSSFKKGDDLGELSRICYMTSISQQQGPSGYSQSISSGKALVSSESYVSVFQFTEWGRNFYQNEVIKTLGFSSLFIESLVFFPDLNLKIRCVLKKIKYSQLSSSQF